MTLIGERFCCLNHKKKAKLHLHYDANYGYIIRFGRKRYFHCHYLKNPRHTQTTTCLNISVTLYVITFVKEIFIAAIDKTKEIKHLILTNAV